MKKLIGGQALRNLGHDRHTDDVDYLVFDATLPVFSHNAALNVDYINGAADNDFFKAICKSEEKNASEIATPQNLLELKCYSLVQHCQNGAWAKVKATEYDIYFLCTKFNLTSVSIVNNHVSAGELKEIVKEIASAHKQK